MVGAQLVLVAQLLIPYDLSMWLRIVVEVKEVMEERQRRATRRRGLIIVFARGLPRDGYPVGLSISALMHTSLQIKKMLYMFKAFRTGYMVLDKNLAADVSAPTDVISNIHDSGYAVLNQS